MACHYSKYILEYGLTCEVRPEETRLRKPSRQISTDDTAQLSFILGKRWLTSSKITHIFAGAVSISLSVGGIGGYDTHLAVDRARGIKSEHIEGYGDEGEHACEGVYLRGWIISTKPQDPMQRDRKKRGTDPYCPPVRAMPSDDTPFIIESD
jgi:hypothetical protein